MIDHVDAGSKITAAQTNAIVDACNGQLMPAEGDFTTTPRGPVFSRGAAPTSLKQSVVPEQLFHCMNANTLKMTARADGDNPPTYDTSKPMRSWMFKVPQSEHALVEVLSEVSHNQVLSAACIAGEDDTLDTVVDDKQLSCCANGWFDSASYSSSSLRIAWMQIDASEDLDGLVAVFTDLPDGDDLEDRVEDTLGVKVATLHSQTLAEAENYAKNSRLRQQWQAPVTGMPLSLSVDGQLSVVLDGDDNEIGLSSLQRKVFNFKVSDEKTVKVPVYSLNGFDDFSTSEVAPTDHIVIRRVQEDGRQAEVKYIPLSSVSVSANCPLPDTDEPTSQLSSVQLHTTTGGAQDYELFKFHDSNYVTACDLSSVSSYQFVVRDGDHINYVSLSGNALSDIIPDARLQNGDIQRSVDWLETAEDRVLQLYNFNIGGDDELSSQLRAKELNDLSPDEEDEFRSVERQILVREETTDSLSQIPTLTYKKLKVIPPDLSGDSQVEPRRSDTDWSYDKSISCGVLDGSYVAGLHNFHSTGQTEVVQISANGEDKYWPQNTTTQGSAAKDEYFLVKEVDNTTSECVLKYKRLQVKMPEVTDYSEDINQLNQSITSITADVSIVSAEIVVLSGQLSTLSSGLSGEFWNSGGSSNTCYGSEIGNSSKSEVIDLDNQQLVGNWEVTSNLSVLGDVVCSGHGDFQSIYGGMVVEAGSMLKAGGSLTIGNTTITESDLQNLLQLVNSAPQMLHNI